MSARTLIDVKLEDDPKNIGSKIAYACRQTVALRYCQVGEGVFLLEPVLFDPGKEIFPDEEIMRYLISMIARNQIVIWSKKVRFLDPVYLDNCHSLDGAQIAASSKHLKINPGDFHWYRVNSMKPLDVLLS